jgi:hypothetical protein
LISGIVRTFRKGVDEIKTAETTSKIPNRHTAKLLYHGAFSYKKNTESNPIL